MANTYLSKAVSTLGSRRKWVYSTWVKRSKIQNTESILMGYEDGNNYTKCQFNGSDFIEYTNVYGGSTTGQKITSAKYRDTNAWYHIYLVWNTLDPASASDRMQIWVNGVRVTALGTDSDPGATTESAWNANPSTHWIGANDAGSNHLLNGYLAQTCSIDGTTPAVTVFGEVDSTTGEWSPKGDSQIRSGVTFGTNGFLLTYENASYLGYDYQTAARSGTPFDYTKNGSGYQSIECPSNIFLNWNVVWNSWAYESAGGGGSSGVPSISYAGTQLNYTSGAYTSCLGTLATSSMKYYFEMEVTGTEPIFGVMAARPAGNASQTYNDTTCNGFYPQDGQKIVNGVFSAGGTGFTGTGHFMVAVNPATNKMWIGKDGTWNGNPSTNTSPLITGMTSTLNNETCEYTPWGHIHNTTTILKTNFGQGYFGSTSAGATNADANGEGVFKYTVPTGFYCLNYKNLKTQNG